MAWVHLVVGIIVTVWLFIGGVLDIKYLFNKLKFIKRNDLDDGRVLDNDTKIQESSETL